MLYNTILIHKNTYLSPPLVAFPCIPLNYQQTHVRAYTKRSPTNTLEVPSNLSVDYPTYSAWTASGIEERAGFSFG